MQATPPVATRKKRKTDPTTVAEYRDAGIASMSEAVLQASVINDAISFGVHPDFIYHTHDSRRSQGGYPDVIMLKDGRGLAMEFKREHHRTLASRMALQMAWLAQYDAIDGMRAYLVKPSQYLDGTVEAALRWLTRREAAVGR